MQAAMKYQQPRETIWAIEQTANTGMYPRDYIFSAMSGNMIFVENFLSGAISAACDRLQQAICNGGETTVTFNSIPPGYSKLLISCYGRCGQAALSADVGLTFNADTTASYDKAVWSKAGPFQAYNQTSGSIGWLTGASATSGYRGSWQCIIDGYSDTNFFKTWYTQGPRFDSQSSDQVYAMTYFGWWKKTAAINSIALSIAGGAIKGTTFTLNGII